MSTRILEIAQDNRYISIHRGFIEIKESGDLIGKVPIDDINSIIGSAHGLIYSQSLLMELAKRNIPLVVCNQAFVPVSVLWPLDGHYNQSAKIDNQLKVTQPLKKQLWKSLISQKIFRQGQTLEVLGLPAGAFYQLSKKVNSGDKENLEGQAAKRYWPLLLGKDFKRYRTGPSPNNLLNYGYIVLRSATARAVVAGGLHPSIGMFHRNKNNPFRLVDDLMEPFRPFIDLLVWKLHLQEGIDELTPDIKSRLVSILSVELESNDFTSSLLNHIQFLVRSLNKSYEEKKAMLQYPNPSLLNLQAILNG